MFLSWLEPADYFDISVWNNIWVVATDIFVLNKNDYDLI